MDRNEVVSGYYDISREKAKKKKLTGYKKHLTEITLGILLVVFALAVFIPSIAITVHAGEKGVLYKRLFGKEGVVLDKVYPEGIYFVLPWNKMTVYNARIQQIQYPLTVLSKQGMKIELSLSIRTRPVLDDLGHLHQQLGPNYIRTVVIPEVEGIVLSLFGKRNIMEIYTDIYQLIENANVIAAKDLKQNNIVLDELIVENITFPKSVRDAIDEKIKQEQIALAYEYRIEAEKREAERKTIEAGGIQSFQSIVSEGISDNYLKWKGIDATLKLASSNNSKVVVIGSGKNGLPLILNTESEQLVKKITRDLNTTNKGN